MKKELKRQIESEIEFLRSEDIMDLVHDADIGSCHEECEAIEKRIVKLKKLIN